MPTRTQQLGLIVLLLALIVFTFVKVVTTQERLMQRDAAGQGLDSDVASGATRGAVDCLTPAANH